MLFYLCSFPLPSPTTILLVQIFWVGYYWIIQWQFSFCSIVEWFIFICIQIFLWTCFTIVICWCQNQNFFLGVSLKKWTNILLHSKRVNCVRTELCFVPTIRVPTRIGKPGKNGKAFSSQGKVREFWAEWENQGKSHKILENSRDKYYLIFLVIFKCAVYYLLK